MARSGRDRCPDERRPIHVHFVGWTGEKQVANRRPPMAPLAVPTTEGGNEHGCYVALGLTAAPESKERALAAAARGWCRRSRRGRGDGTPGGAASGIGGHG